MSSIRISPRIYYCLLAMFLILTAVGPFAGSVTAAPSVDTTELNIHDFQQVSETSGWLWMDQQLYWTDNNGAAWRNSTPAGTDGTLMDVVFLDEQTGWTIFGQATLAQFAFAHTVDGGMTWTITSHEFPAIAQMPSSVSAIDMGWRDALHGWVVFKFATGSNFSVGLLYTTQDGGMTWQLRDLPLGEPALFLDDLNGWVAGGPAGKLYRTEDGGQTWREETSVSAGYSQLPVFVDVLHGILPVITIDQQIEFYRTEDAGQTWTLVGRVPLEPDTSPDISLPLSRSDDGTLIFIVPNSDRMIKINDAGLVETRSDDGQSSGIIKLDMYTAQNGWAQWTFGSCSAGSEITCTRETKLLTTNDGGVHWQPITLPTGQSSIREEFSSTGKGTDETLQTFGMPDPDTKAYQGQGFDKCEVPTLSQMQQWWTSSPYNAVNLYIGGSSRGCLNTALTSSFISSLGSQGWRFIPTWVGPQANCTGYSSRMSSNASTAYDQGVAEADLASDRMLALGLSESDGSGTVVYYDLEAYNTSNTTCRSAANAFISGWVAQMQARGNLAGVYGASCSSAVSDWAAIENVPDALWIANWYGNAGTVSYRQNASVWGAACLSDSLWADHQRLRQYAGDHNETWGGITLNIDSNVLDGPLTVRNGTGAVSVPSVPIRQGPSQGAILDRTNDTWLTWKTTGDSCSIHIWGGSMDVTVTSDCAFYRLGVRPGGAYSWQVTSTNDVGSTVGPLWQFKVRPHGASNLATGSVAATRVNLSWQLSSDDPANIDGYNIYRDGVLAGSVNKSVASFQVTSLACNSSFSFHVKSVRQGVESDASNTVDATTTTCAPVLTSPAEGTLLENQRPNLQWQAVELATAYQVQVSLYSNFSTAAINTQVSATSYVSTKNLTVNTKYYWRVRGVGPFGYGDWSEVRSFITANPPSLPRISSPVNGSLTTNYQPTLNWTDSIAPEGTQLDHYQVQLATSNTFTSVLYDQTTTASEFPLPAELISNTKYFWRVRAYNNLGQYSAWAPIWSFRTAILPPTLTSPPGGFLFVHQRPALDWSDVAGATRYTLQLSKVPNFSSALTTKYPAASQFTFTTDLARNTLYYWRVRTDAPNGPSTWSEVWAFTTGNPPGIPVLNSPALNALVTNYQPRLDWGDVTVPAGTQLDHYQIQLAGDAAFTMALSDHNVTVSEYVPAPALDPNTKYYWRVRAWNMDGHYSAWSAVRYFRAAMLAPVLIAPLDHSIEALVRPAFSWQSVDGAASYTIQISLSSTFAPVLVNARVLTTSFTPSLDLPAGMILYWRVRANGPNGPSLWSDVYEFQIQ